MEKGEKFLFTGEDGEEAEYYILEETTLGEERFLLVTEGDPDQEELEVLVLRQSGGDEDTLLYEIEEDESVTGPLLSIFEELLSDSDS